ncbi:MAG TPA: pyridoxamine 5'-phosphate oxidase family protein [Candidatus Limnocylindria bacterium]|nr:pyridoxamine 5'-phosphate oxidase family protein [Candidatus Limnocylindria bacterium]
MKLAERMKPGGIGVIATAAPDGSVNTAIYAPPHLSDDGTAAWGMSEGRTYRNVRGNPNASYLYIAPGDGYRGVRLTMKLKEIRDSGDLLETIRSRTKQSSGEGAAIAVKYVAFFEIVEERPLV